MGSEEDDVCEEYASSLEDLTFNSKPLINVLTMLAEENSKFASKIVKLIDKRILEVCDLPVMILSLYPYTQHVLVQWFTILIATISIIYILEINMDGVYHALLVSRCSTVAPIF